MVLDLTNDVLTLPRRPRRRPSKRNRPASKIQLAKKIATETQVGSTFSAS
jgi:hypothetical protein